MTDIKTLVSVKALEWRVFCGNSGNAEAEAFGDQYFVQNEGGVWLLYRPYQDTPVSHHGELNDAKAAAQADYEARILSSLSPSREEGEAVTLRTIPPSLYADIVAPYSAALRMIRESIGELFGPVASIESEEAVLLRGPEPHHDAEAIIAALQRISAAEVSTLKAEVERLREAAYRVVAAARLVDIHGHGALNYIVAPYLIEELRAALHEVEEG